MLPARWNDVKDKFEEALLLEPALRAVYLAELCAGDPDLHEELESLIAAHERSGSYFLNSPLADVTPVLASDVEHDRLAGRRIGSYQIMRQIGAGGMGEVYSAFRADDEYKKLVAIKLVRSGQGSDFVLSRFKNERQILASLDHPNIARLLDGGTTTDGLPYFVMELIEGQPIDEYCAARKLSITDRLNLFLHVCLAVQFAHQHLVIHRDIKPGNILVTSDGVPKLLDFGIAKILEGTTGGEEFDATLTAFRVLTLGYASPEQIKGEPIATASDVYSLGVVLFKLLTGQSPYRVTSSIPHEVSRAVCEFEPEKPSVAVRRVTNGKTGDGADSDTSAGFNEMGCSSAQKLSRRLSGDLDNIVLVALRKEPSRRYLSVEEFHGDIRRHLGSLPVIARKSTFRYRSWKFINRYKLGVSALAVIAVILISALVVTLHANRVARQQSEIARAQRARAEHRFNDVRKLAKSLIFDLPGPIHNLPGSLRVEKMLLDNGLEYLDSLAAEAEGDASLQRELAAGYKRLGDSQGMPYGNSLGDSAGALASYRKALQMRQKLVQSDPRNISDQIDLAMTFRKIGSLLYRMGDVQGARENVHRALEIVQPVAKANPDNVNALKELGVDFMETGNVEGGGTNISGLAANPAIALQHHLDALKVFKQLAARHPEERLWQQQVAYLDGGASIDSLECGRLTDAINYAREALSILSRLTDGADAGTRSVLKNQMAAMHSLLGDAMLSSGRWSDATTQYRKELSLYGELYDPDDPFTISAMANGYINTGNSLVNSGNARSGLQFLRKGLTLAEPLMKTDSSNSDPPAEVAIALVYEGEALEQLGDELGALDVYRKASLLFQSPVLSEKPAMKTQTAAALAKMAGVQAKLGRRIEAHQTYLKALELVEPKPGTQPANVVSNYVLIDIYAGIGDLATQLANQGGFRVDNSNDPCRWYQKSRDVWMQLPIRNTVAPNGFEVTDFITVTRKLTKCSQLAQN